MVLEFKVGNFRSFKQEQVFSFVAEASKNKPNNVFEIPLPKGTSVRLLKSAVIYGANASGKSNFLKALYALCYFVTKSDSFKIDKGIDCYEPFLLDELSKGTPTQFDITFIIDSTKYHYSIAFNESEVISEILSYYPNGQIANLYNRKRLEGDYHEIEAAKNLKKTGLPKRVLKNQLILSKFGSEPHEQLNDVYRFFDAISIGNTLDTRRIQSLVEELGKEINKPENHTLAQRINLLIKAADTSIKSIFVGDISQREVDVIKQLPLSEKFKDKLIEDNRSRVFGQHAVFDNEKNEIDTVDFDFRSHISVGTTAMFAIGGMILKKLESGGLVVFDELDNSLHPKISRFFIQLFHSLNTNIGNAQIIFSTHEPLLMDKDMFRSDQIWFTEKNKFGETNMYSAQDFEGVREDIPFDKWYMAGKFGALPNIQESIFAL